jgi:hypothetical protein
MTDFTGPSSVDAVDWKSLYGKLLAIWPYGREVVGTKFGEKAAIRADIYDLDAGMPVSMDALIFPRALVMQCGGIPRGKAVIGRLGQGESRGGQNPPWKITDPTPEDLARAQAYFAAKPARIHAMQGRTAPPSPTSQPVAQPQPAQPQPSYTYPPQPAPQPTYQAPPNTSGIPY